MRMEEKLKEQIERILDELLFSPGESDDGYTYNLSRCIDQITKLVFERLGEGV